MSGSDIGLPARRAALAALRAVGEDGAYANLAVPAAIDHLESAQDRAFAAHLAYDTLRWEGTLDWALGHVLTRPLADVEAALVRVLRLGTLQLLRTDVPARAAVATSASLAREQVPPPRAKGAAGFVNGVLRALDRRRTTLPWPQDDDHSAEALGLRTGHPVWVVTDLQARYGERTEAILDADNRPPGVTLRVAPDARAELIDELRMAGVDAREGGLPEAIRAPGADPQRLAAVTEGRAVVQDEASMHVVRGTGVKPGHRVLDLCAGPGGKTSHLAAAVGPAGHVTAIELHPHRARLIRQSLARQQLEDRVTVLVGDAASPPLDDDATFDVVLLDAPCTGLGTGRRRPEVRWRRQPQDAEALGALQRQLLDAAARRVADGGHLTYAVCTWTADETDAVTTAFDRRVPTSGFVPGERVQLLPDRDDTDGMYVARWRRPDGHGS